VAQVYVQYPAVERMPVKELKAFKRVHVAKGGASVVEFRIPVSDLQKWDLQKKQWMLYSGEYTFVAGSHANDKKLSVVINTGNRRK
jgi:beta-glucosidase